MYRPNINDQHLNNRYVIDVGTNGGTIINSDVQSTNVHFDNWNKIR